MLLSVLMVTWGVVTAVLVVLVIYRETLSWKEDDQVFIDDAEQTIFYTEQQEIIAKMSRLKRPIIALAVLSGVLLLSGAGVWIHKGFNGF
jgi:hypothetical protein